MQTILAAPELTGGGALTSWRQCVDLVAQYDRPGKAVLESQDRDMLLERLEALRGRVSETQRIATVVELGSRLSSPALIRFFAGDRPAICAAAMSRARLPDNMWSALLPELGPVARSVLRGRRDMGPETRRGLESLGHVDFVLTSASQAAEHAEASASASAETMDLTAEMQADPVEAPTVPAQNQIRQLVDRIEQFTHGRRRDQAPPVQPTAAQSSDLRSFEFETDARGIMVWVDSGPRPALIGLNIAEVPLPGGSGPDASVTGAFARRSGFGNGRFTIVGGSMAGEWRISATPFFDPLTGRFQGYKGQARRPHLHEVPVAAPQGIAGMTPDSVRQLIHELRTPLNAILGFAEIIEQQIFGPAATQYRGMAGQIVLDARKLLSAFEELDIAAKLPAAIDGDKTAVDPALLIGQAAAHYHDVAEGRVIDIGFAPDLPQVRVETVQAGRLVQHLFRTLISVAGGDEAISGQCWHQPGGDGGKVVLAVARPAALRGMEEAQLLDPGYTLEGDWPDASLLGVGFSFRLIRSLANAIGGSFQIEADRFVTALPVAAGAADQTSSS